MKLSLLIVKQGSLEDCFRKALFARLLDPARTYTYHIMCSRNQYYWETNDVEIVNNAPIPELHMRVEMPLKKMTW
jgi:hypothetical protein